jgi:CheY-like chemotaxis protein
MPIDEAAIHIPFDFPFVAAGLGQAEDRRKSSEAGFDGHLVKPAEHPALLAMLKQLREAKKV